MRLPQRLFKRLSRLHCEYSPVCPTGCDQQGNESRIVRKHPRHHLYLLHHPAPARTPSRSILLNIVVTDIFVNDNFGDIMITLTPDEVRARFGPLFSMKFLVMVDQKSDSLRSGALPGPGTIEDAANRARAGGAIQSCHIEGTMIRCSPGWGNPGLKPRIESVGRRLKGRGQR